MRARDLQAALELVSTAHGYLVKGLGQGVPPAVVGRPLDPGVHAPVVHHKPSLPEALVARHLLRRDELPRTSWLRWHSSSSLSSIHCAASPLRLCGWEDTQSLVGIQSCANLRTVVRVVPSTQKPAAFRRATSLIAATSASVRPGRVGPGAILRPSQTRSFCGGPH